MSGSYPESSLVTDDEWDDHSVGSTDPADQHAGEAVADHDDPEEEEDYLESGLRMGAGRSKVPFNDIAYDEGNDDSDDDSPKTDKESQNGKSLGFRVSEQQQQHQQNVIQDKQYHSSSALVAAASAGGDNSPSTKNPLTRGL